MLLTSVAVLALGASAAPTAAGRPMPGERDSGGSGIGLQLLEIPVARAQDPRANAYIVDHLEPGTSIQRRVEVRNTSDERHKVELYAGAASVEKNIFTAADGRGGNELSDWVTLDSDRVELAPGARKRVQVTVAVPGTASAGERYAAVWAQVTSPARDGGVTQVHRVGVRMYLDIGMGGEPPTDFRIDQMAVGSGSGSWPVVTAWVHNTGRRALDMDGTLHLANDSETVRAGPFRVTTGVTILPGQRGQVSTTVDQPLAAGTWTAQLILSSGTVRRTAEAELVLPGVAQKAKSAGPGLLLFVPGAAVALLLIAGLLGWRLRRARLRR
ncbi:hypothetical protein I0C86_22400 [Plantactinospora sp. S1510]|uniref:Peptidase n=1 Tax=Plantactinospora alkalitolerans TaxID=2789879 RepID=A0ABS0GZS7_9ACTN|nr:hypothetical protein [Plantactinospora alkalitolerans]MBF9131695.1 hypothetical protein [Plantactinospora alkalitolerans]